MNEYTEAIRDLADAVTSSTREFVMETNAQIIAMIPVVLAILAGILCYIFLNRWAKYRKKRFFEKAKANHNYTTARYVKHFYVHGDGDSSSSMNRYDRVHVTYEYYVNGKRYKKKYCYSGEGKMAATYPNSFTIYYSGRNPRRARAEDENKSSEWRSGCLTSIVVMVIFINVCKLCINAVFGMG